VAPLLSIKGLCKEFRAGSLWAARRVRALDHVNLEVNSGETLGLVGESGCGKTTLARCILRLTEPSSGSVCFDGSDLSLLSPEVLRQKRREFQIIFQDPFASLDPNLTIRQILFEPYEVHHLGTRRERQQWIEELADAVSLDRVLLRRRPASLSGGQQQRVGIARALALKPRLLVADEPVSALDASVQAQILNLLADLQRRFGLTLVLISHSLQVTHYICSRIVVMYLGRIVEEATAAEFFARAKHPYSELLLRSMPALEVSGTRPPLTSPGEIPKATAPPAGCAFHPRCPHAQTRCREEIPELTPCGPSSKVACFLYT
jgi:oligopeptide/dipeptide ABC transporter ATP-binding protein